MRCRLFLSGAPFALANRLRAVDAALSPGSFSWASANDFDFAFRCKSMLLRLTRSSTFERTCLAESVEFVGKSAYADWLVTTHESVPVTDYVRKILDARVYDVACRRPLDPMACASAGGSAPLPFSSARICSDLLVQDPRRL